MLNFFISIVVFSISTFLLAVAIRYGTMASGRLDAWLLSKSGKDFTGFQWYFRIPFAIGAIPEYFYAMVLSRENYFKLNWWALKSASFISVFLFIALLKSRSAVASYYSLDLFSDQGWMALFTSGTFIWYLNFITLMYLALAVIVVIESIRMAGIFAPIRVLYQGLLCVLMANLTVITLSVIVLISVIYLIYKIIKFLFFSSKSQNASARDDDESAGEILSKGFSGFRAELYEWEANRTPASYTETKPATRHKPVITRKKRTVKPKVEPMNEEDDLPRLHPD